MMLDKKIQSAKNPEKDWCSERKMCEKTESLIPEKTKAAIIVDDNKDVLRTFSLILQLKGYATDTANTGKEALDKIGFKHFDVALIDSRLSDIEGTDLIAKFPANTGNMVKIVLTGLQPLKASQTELEVDAYLLKPIKPDDLIAIIEKNLKKRSTQ